MTQTARGVHKNELVGFTRAIAFALLAVLAYGIGAALRPGDSSVQAVPTHCIEWFCVEVSGDEDRDGDPDFGVCMAGPIPQSDWYCNANFRGVAFRGSQGRCARKTTLTPARIAALQSFCPLLCREAPFHKCADLRPSPPSLSVHISCPKQFGPLREV